MKITPSQLIQQKEIALKTTVTSERIKPTGQLDQYIPTKKAALWSYSASEVQIFTRNSFTRPNWDMIPTKGMPTPPQEELVAQIQELARNMPDKETGTREQWDSFWNQKYRLMAQYQSAVSPDRKALHAQALKVAKMVEEEQPKDVRPVTLVDYLVMDDLNIKLDPEAQQAKVQGSTVTPVHKTGGGYDYQIHYGGERVMMSHNGQWGAVLTAAELERNEEFSRIFEASQK